MNIMLVAHGAHFSTYDIYNYYLAALKRKEGINVHAFPYHRALDYHGIAVHHVYPELTKDEKGVKAIYAASRDIITEIILSEADVILFVGGLAIPPKLVEVAYNLRDTMIDRYSMGFLFTESPYQDADQEKYMQYCDFAFFNDKYSAEKYNPDNELLIDYLPHSYNPAIHYSFGDSVKNTDVIFCGTLYPNRLDFFSEINWDGINAKLVGPFGIYENKERYSNISDKIIDATVTNYDLSTLYRESKLSINIHRGGRDFYDHDQFAAYSMNPRIRESVMCGCLPITDHRDEIVDIFGDSVPIVETSEQMENVIKHLLVNDDERHNRLAEAQKKCKGDTYANHLENIILPLIQEVGVINGKVSRT